MKNLRVITVILVCSLLIVPCLRLPSAAAQPLPSFPMDVPDDAFQQEESALQRAQQSVHRQNYETAIALLNAVIWNPSSQDELDDAIELLQHALINARPLREAIDHVEALNALVPTTDRYTKRALLRTIAGMHETAGDRLSAVETMLREYHLVEEREPSLARQIDTMLQLKLSTRELHELAERYPNTFPGDSALVQLIQRYHRNATNEVFALEALVNVFVSRFPTHEYAPTARMRLIELREQLRSHQSLIGVVLPLTGNLAGYGREVLNGIRLALTQDPGQISVGMVVQDTSQDDMSLIEMVERLWISYHPVAVIGPLLSRDMKRLAAWSETHQLPILSPTASDPDVPRSGSFLFTTALTGNAVGRAIARYAMRELGMRRFSILYPDDPYGMELTNAFQETVREMGGRIIAKVPYQSDETDFGPHIQRIQEEDLRHDGALFPATGKEKDARPRYVPGFDAIFIPGDSTAVGLITAHLKYHGMTVAILGSNGWNSPELVRIGERAVEGGIFVDIFFLNSEEPAVQHFVKQYQSHFESDPTVFAAAAYDTARTVIEAIRQGATTSTEVGRFLRELRNFPSLSGPADMVPPGTLTRPLFVLKVEHGTFVQIDKVESRASVQVN